MRNLNEDQVNKLVLNGLQNLLISPPSVAIYNVIATILVGQEAPEVNSAILNKLREIMPDVVSDIEVSLKESLDHLEMDSTLQAMGYNWVSKEVKLDD